MLGECCVGCENVFNDSGAVVAIPDEMVCLDHPVGSFNDATETFCNNYMAY